MRYVREGEAGVGDENVVVVRGANYKLRDGWTFERVVAEAARSQSPHPLRCKIKHGRKVIGDPFIAEDPIEAMCTLIARTTSLTWCPRCGTIAEKGEAFA